MIERDNQQEDNLSALTAEIIGAYVMNNTVPSGELPGLIANVHNALSGLEAGTAETVSAPEVLKPAVSIKKSIRNDYLICLEDGKHFKSLKRHLRTHFDLSPEQYREKWGLPATYPMVAPGYAKRRSELAKQMGLGNGRRSKQAASDVSFEYFIDLFNGVF